MSMSREARDAELKNDLGWLDDLTIHNINGQYMLGDGEIPFNVETIIGEQEFTRNWLIQFAVGNDVGNGVNYFDRDGWLAISSNGQRAVMIVTDEEKPRPLFVVPPLLSHNMTDQDYAMMRRASVLIHNANANAQSNSGGSGTMKVAGAINQVLSNVKRRTYTDLVPEAFYERCSLIPRLEKRIYYIRDVIQEGKAKLEDLNRVREIIYRDFKGEANSNEDILFVKELTKDRYDFTNKDAESVTSASPTAVRTTAVNTNLNPDEC